MRWAAQQLPSHRLHATPATFLSPTRGSSTHHSTCALPAGASGAPLVPPLQKALPDH